MLMFLSSYLDGEPSIARERPVDFIGEDLILAPQSTPVARPDEAWNSMTVMISAQRARPRRSASTIPLIPTKWQR